MTWGIRPMQIVVSQTEVSQRFKNFSRFAGQSSTDVAQLSYFGAVSKQTASVLVLFCFSKQEQTNNWSGNLFRVMLLSLLQ